MALLFAVAQKVFWSSSCIYQPIVASKLNFLTISPTLALRPQKLVFRIKPTLTSRKIERQGYLLQSTELSCFVTYRIRQSTWNRFQSITKQKTPLSELLRKATTDDPVAPVLSDLQFEAIDRRLKIAINTVKKCIKQHGESAVLISDAVV